MLNKIIIILVLLIFNSSQVLTCEVPPEEQSVDPRKLIERTSNIVLAKVIKAETTVDGYEVKYTFKVLNVLKGQVDDTFDLIGYPLSNNNINFNHHYDLSFWKNDGVGRSPNDTDCEIHPSFAVGSIYLVFLDQPYHIKSFELIIRTHGNKETKDKWLQYVEEQINKP